MKTVTTVVFAHGDEPEHYSHIRKGGSSAAFRHLPIWLHNTDNLIIVSPIDNPVLIKNINCVTYELRQHHGQFAIRRILFAMELALLMYHNTDYFVFLEYDALMLRRPKDRPQIQGNLFNERFFLNRDEDKMNSGKCFLHFPWIFPNDKLKLFLEKVSLDPNCDTPHDIWIAQKLMEYDFSIFNLLKIDTIGRNFELEGFSKNSIDTEEALSEAAFYASNGAYAFHGVKEEECLSRILQAKIDSIK
jgi:hypothetical protein